MNETSVSIAPGLLGELALPARSRGIVLLIDGSAGGREQVRHRVVAGYLQRRQMATLQLQTPTADRPAAELEDRERIAQLAHALLQALAWVRREAAVRALPIGVFGSGCGAAAAIVCAAERSAEIAALASRAAPLELVRADLARLQSPVLLIVGALDADALVVTREAYRALTTEKRLEVVPRATHLFEEAGALERVANAAGDWFSAHFGDDNLA